MPNGNENKIPPAAPQPAPKASDQVGLRVSLIPVEELQRRDPRAGFRHFMIAVAVFVVLFGSVAGFLWYQVDKNLAEVKRIDAETAVLAKQSKDLDPSIKEAKAAQARLRALGSLLLSHKTGLRLLSFLEAHTLPDVAFSALSVSENGAVNLAAETTSYESYAAQINELRAQKEIKSLSASGLSPVYNTKNEIEKVNFNLTLNFDTSIFLDPESEPSPAK